MFKFKQFSISQEKTAMKVCTDACAFGALVPVKNKQKILDIGTGTGLLALMLAQKSNVEKIIGIEIEPQAAEEALKNVKKSPFFSTIDILNMSLQDFTIICKEKFDLIISNPPFYDNHLKSEKLEKNMALHTLTLSFEDLLSSSNSLLKVGGNLWILLPPFQMDQFEKLAKKYLFFAQEWITLAHNQTKKPFRIIANFKKNTKIETKKKELIIFETDNKTYTSEFKELLKEYYLIF